MHVYNYNTFLCVKENARPQAHFDTLLNGGHGKFISGICNKRDCKITDFIPWWLCKFFLGSWTWVSSMSVVIWLLWKLPVDNLVICGLCIGISLSLLVLSMASTSSSLTSIVSSSSCDDVSCDGISSNGMSCDCVSCDMTCVGDGLFL